MLEPILTALTGESVIDVPSLLAGSWVSDGSLHERTGPYVRRTVSRATYADEAMVRTAVEYAHMSARRIAASSPAARASVLESAAGLAVEHRRPFARLIALELGKPVKDGLGEMDRVADTLAVCAAEARQIGGELLPVAGWARGIGNTAMTYRAPAGIALAITPFNAPANLLAHKLGASFAAGNTTIVKGPPQAPAVTAGIVALLVEAGVPVEAVQ